MEEFISLYVFVILGLICSFIVLAAMMFSADRTITRLGMMICGFALICVAGFFASEVLAWQGIGESLIGHKKKELAISKKAFAEFQRKATFVLWIIPFITGSLGTNMISDALMNHERYKNSKSSSESIPATILKWGFMLVPRLAFWLFVTIVNLLFNLLSKIGNRRKWRVKAKLYRRSYRRRYAKSKQPWQY